MLWRRSYSLIHAWYLVYNVRIKARHMHDKNGLQKKKALKYSPRSSNIWVMSCPVAFFACCLDSFFIKLHMKINNDDISLLLLFPPKLLEWGCLRTILIFQQPCCHSDNFIYLFQISAYAAIPPPISTMVPIGIDQSTYSGSGNEYSVEIGRVFQLLCISSGEHSGHVTWLRVDNGGKPCVLEVPLLSCLSYLQLIAS